MEEVMKKIAALNEKHNELTEKNAEQAEQIRELQRENLVQSAVLAEQSKEISGLYEIVDRNSDEGETQ